jgi:hypothetical protein
MQEMRHRAVKREAVTQGAPMELQVIRFAEFVRLDAHGRLDMAASRAVLSRVADICRKRACPRALLDGRDMQAELTPSELAALVREFAEMGFTRHQRLALLHRGGPHHRAALFVLIGRLHGWKLQAFGDFEEALDWLSTGPEIGARSQTSGEQIPLRTRKPAPALAAPRRQI